MKLLAESVKIYSPTKEEESLSQYLMDQMRRLGYRNVRTDDAKNAIGELGSGHPHVLLCGHMDTVPGILENKVEGGRVYGRGAADAKSPLCAMIWAAAGASVAGMRVTMACVTREESDSLGVKTLIKAGGDYDYAVFGEPAGAAKVTVGYRGRIAAHISLQTHGGHASSSWAHPSAVDESISLISRLKEYEERHTVQGNHYKSLTASLTIMRGGSFSNVVPKDCTMTFDVRIPPGMTTAAVKNDLSDIVSQHAASREGVRASIEFDETTEPYDAPIDSVVVRAFQRSILRNLGAKPVLTHKTGTGDMNTLSESMGIPCVTYGPADSNLGHTEMEFVEIADYLASIKVIQGALAEMAALHKA